MTFNIHNFLHGLVGLYRDIRPTSDQCLPRWALVLVALISCGLMLAPLRVIAVPHAFLSLLGFAAMAFSRPTDTSLRLFRCCVVLVSASVPSYVIAALGVSMWLVAAHLALTVVLLYMSSIDPSGGQAGLGGRAETDCFDGMDLRALRASGASLFVEVGPAIGQYRGKDIPGYFVDPQGRKHIFLETCPDPAHINMGEGQTLVPPGLLYELEKG